MYDCGNIYGYIPAQVVIKYFQAPRVSSRTPSSDIKLDLARFCCRVEDFSLDFMECAVLYGGFFCKCLNSKIVTR